jgi:hypothetical protein
MTGIDFVFIVLIRYGSAVLVGLALAYFLYGEDTK